MTTFVQTRTASVVTRSSYSTLPNGRVSTVLQAVTLPIVTVSVTSAGAVQTGFETVTIDGQAVVVATQTQYVAGGQVVVTRTIQNGSSPWHVSLRTSLIRALPQANKLLLRSIQRPLKT